MLCIAMGEKCPKIADNFCVTVDKNYPKVEDNFLNIFININKVCLKDIFCVCNNIAVLQCFCHWVKNLATFWSNFQSSLLNLFHYLTCIGFAIHDQVGYENLSLAKATVSWWEIVWWNLIYSIASLVSKRRQKISGSSQGYVWYWKLKFAKI